jgi:hypothetical protein
MVVDLVVAGGRRGFLLDLVLEGKVLLIGMAYKA